MLQRAEIDAGNQTEISRHIAVVTLDAAVENAMGIATFETQLDDVLIASAVRDPIRTGSHWLEPRTLCLQRI